VIRFDLITDNALELVDEWSNLMTAMADAKRDFFVGSVANVIIRTGHRSEVVEMQWGLIPHFAQDPDYGKKYGFNARVEGSKDRAEGIENMRTFRESIQAWRCVVPVSSYFEQYDGHWWGFCPEGRPYFPLAGIYEPGHMSEMPTFAIVTVPANSLGAKYNERMPYVLRPEDIESWLEPKYGFDVVRSAVATWPEEEMRAEDRGSNKKIKEEIP
jgi:putative SOS response-associated peptidase YedK